ncbi:MAG TPA: rhodanese-like domain-containing protein [Armatimonadaceae bacterium]|nr:rhodanese-like domain-containing protein [Armatimonadaceae bacterium]
MSGGGERIPEVSLDELRARLASESPPVLVEAMPLPYFRHSHLPGARHLPPDRVAQVAPELLPDRSAEIIVYCQGPG